jgi:hypothetical protein
MHAAAHANRILEAACLSIAPRPYATLGSPHNTKRSEYSGFRTKDKIELFGRITLPGAMGI